MKKVYLKKKRKGGKRVRFIGGIKLHSTGFSSDTTKDERSSSPKEKMLIRTIQSLSLGLPTRRTKNKQRGRNKGRNRASQRKRLFAFQMKETSSDGQTPSPREVVGQTRARPRI